MDFETILNWHFFWVEGRRDEVRRERGGGEEDNLDFCIFFQIFPSLPALREVMHLFIHSRPENFPSSHNLCNRGVNIEAKRKTISL